MPNSDERHPVVAGLIALVAVSVAVALIVGVSAFAAAHVLHLGGGSGGSGSGNDGASLYLPEPSPTLTPSNPLVTLSSEPSESGSGHASRSSSPSKSASPSKKPAQINLSAGEVSVSPMASIDLSGTYDGGEGHLLRVQRKSAGSGWEDFPVPDADVQGGQFSTSVQTGRTGKQMFRVKDVDTHAVSNVVTVTVG